MFPGLFSGLFAGLGKDKKDDGMQPTTGSRILGGIAAGLGGGMQQGPLGGLFGSMLPTGLQALSDMLRKKKEAEDGMGGM